MMTMHPFACQLLFCRHKNKMSFGLSGLRKCKSKRSTIMGGLALASCTSVQARSIWGSLERQRGARPFRDASGKPLRQPQLNWVRSLVDRPTHRNQVNWGTGLDLRCRPPTRAKAETYSFFSPDHRLPGLAARPCLSHFHIEKRNKNKN